MKLYKPGSVACAKQINGASFLFFGQEDTGILTTVTYLKLSSFVYSLTNITSLAIPYILKDTLLLSPAQVGIFSALCSAPAFLKPVAAIFIPASQRPLILSICPLIQTAAYLGIGLAISKGAASAPLVIGFMFAHSVASSIGMVLRDTLTVESATVLESSSAAHRFFADLSMIQRIGLLPVSYLSGYLLSHVSPGRLILYSAIFPAIMAAAASTLKSDYKNRQIDAKFQIQRAVDVISDSKKGLLSTVSGRGLFTCIVPSVSDVMFFFYTQELGLTPEFLGRFQLLGAVGGIAGISFSRLMADFINPRSLANIATVLQVPLFFSTVFLTSHMHLGISKTSFILIRHFLIDFLLSLTSVPASVQLAKTAPEGAQGAYLSLVGTLGDVGGFANSLISSATMTAYGIDRTHFSSLTDMVIVCNSMYAGLVPALFYYDEPSAPKKGVPQTFVDKTPKVEELLDNPSPVRDA